MGRTTAPDCHDCSPNLSAERSAVGQCNEAGSINQSL